MAKTLLGEVDGCGQFRTLSPDRPRRKLGRGVLRAFARDVRGATALEYALIGGLIFAVAAGGMRAYGARTATVYNQIGNAMAQVN